MAWSERKRLLFDYIESNVFEFEDRSDKGLRPLWNFEFRPHTLSDQFLTLVAETFWEELELQSTVQFLGLEFSGIPLALSLARYHHKNWCDDKILAHRKNKKSALNHSLIEGVFSQDRVVVVDDILSSGATAKAAIDEIQRLGGEVELVAIIVDFLRNDCDEEVGKVNRMSLFTLSDFGIPEFEIYE